MKPHLEARNCRMYNEFHHRKATGENRWKILEELAKRENLALETARLICEWKDYGRPRHKKTVKFKVTACI